MATLHVLATWLKGAGNCLSNDRKLPKRTPRLERFEMHNWSGLHSEQSVAAVTVARKLSGGTLRQKQRRCTCLHPLCSEGELAFSKEQLH